MKYRREIDGLRAIAVLPVIFFHAGFDMFSGGFVGVDIFFVISGYLITKIIVDELEQEKFSIVNFYERRARRILPALFLVMLVCIPFSWFWLLPGDMKDFSKSLVAVSIFVSNILFWRESGYFDSSAELKPLLHTWSLAVEEQYYVLFPLFLMLFWKLGKRWILVAFGIIFLISLSAAQWAAYTKPTAAFYLLPARGWELILGAYSAFYLSQNNYKKCSKEISEFGGWLGIVLIIYAVFTFSKATPFPGFYALVPTLGAVLIILFSTEETTAGKFLGNKTFVGIGMISYSAYLWHQPLFAFARHQFLTEPSKVGLVFLSLVALFLGYLSWKLIESPFREKAVFSRKKIYIFSAAGCSIFITIGFLGILTKGFESRFSSNQLQLLSFGHYEFKEIYRQGDCFLNPEQSYRDFNKKCYAESSGEGILVWGDSHAAALSYGLRETFNDVSQYTASGCPPILDVPINWRPMCEDVNKFVSEEISSKKPKVIILHANWILYNDQKPEVNLVKTLAFIKKFSPNSRVVIFGGVPQYTPSLPMYMVKRHIGLIDNAKLFSPKYDQIAFIDSFIKELGSQYGAIFFSSLDSFCDNNGCLVADRYKGILMPTSWDGGHLTSAGSVYLAKKFKLFNLQQ